MLYSAFKQCFSLMINDAEDGRSLKIDIVY